MQGSHGTELQLLLHDHEMDIRCIHGIMTSCGHTGHTSRLRSGVGYHGLRQLLDCLAKVTCCDSYEHLVLRVFTSGFQRHGPFNIGMHGYPHHAQLKRRARR
jgi:hypothetical protein